jgi:hypothetical protein
MTFAGITSVAHGAPASRTRTALSGKAVHTGCVVQLRSCGPPSRLRRPTPLAPRCRWRSRPHGGRVAGMSPGCSGFLRSARAYHASISTHVKPRGRGDRFSSCRIATTCSMGDPRSLCAL